MQLVIVAIIVSLAAAYATWQLLPRALRQAAAARIAGWATRAGMASERASDIGRRLSKTGGCSSCDDCGACGAPKSDAAGTQVKPVVLVRRS